MKQKRQIGILVILVLIAAFVWLLNFRSKPVTADGGPSIQDDPRDWGVENPRPRTEEIERARKAEYKSAGRNIFSYAAQAPASGGHQSAPAIVEKMPCGIEAGPCLPPPPPPLVLPPNIKYFGYAVVPNGTSRQAAFHDTNDGEVYVVAEGEILLKRFRILRIGNANLEFEEISSGRKGVAPLVEDQNGAPPQ